MRLENVKYEIEPHTINVKSTQSNQDASNPSTFHKF